MNLLPMLQLSLSLFDFLVILYEFELKVIDLPVWFLRLISIKPSLDSDPSCLRFVKIEIQLTKLLYLLSSLSESSVLELFAHFIKEKLYSSNLNKHSENETYQKKQVQPLKVSEKISNS